MGYLLGSKPDAERRWLDRGCILFSQYYDTVRWVGDELAMQPEFAGIEIGLYAGSNRSGSWKDGGFKKCKREVIKARVQAGNSRSFWARTLPPRA